MMTIQARFAAALATAAVTALTGGEAVASGFAIKEQSARAQGNAFAGATAGAEDPSYMFFNPAALAYQEGLQVQLGASLIVPLNELEDAEGSTVTGAPIPGETNENAIGDPKVVPSFYASYAVRPELSFGLGINVPFGLGTDYPDDWVGRYHGLYSDLKTININPAVAVRPIPQVSLGGGLQIQYAHAELTNAIDLGSIGAAAIGANPGIAGAFPVAPAPLQQDGRVQVEGEDWAFGYTLGAIAELPVKGMRAGIAYRSELDHTLDGDGDFTLDNSGVGQTLSALNGSFVDSDVTADLDTPASLGIGLHWDIDERWAVMGEVQWTGWSSFDDLVVEFDNEDQADSVTEQEWQDTWFGALGLTYRPNERWTLRGGVAYDQSPVRNEFRTPRIPDNDRYWVSIGASYEPQPWLIVDAAATHIFVEDSEVDLDTDGAGNTFRGNLEADYESSIELFSISARIIF